MFQLGKMYLLRSTGKAAIVSFVVLRGSPKKTDPPGGDLMHLSLFCQGGRFSGKSDHFLWVTPPVYRMGIVIWGSHWIQPGPLGNTIGETKSADPFAKAKLVSAKGEACSKWWLGESEGGRGGPAADF